MRRWRWRLVGCVTVGWLALSCAGRGTGTCIPLTEAEMDAIQDAGVDDSIGMHIIDINAHCSAAGHPDAGIEPTS